MKKNICFLIIILIIVHFGVIKILDYFNFHLVGHEDIGGFINIDELGDHQVTMLHFYSNDITVHSDSNKPISFVKFGLKTPLNMYINKSIAIQNHMQNYDKYTNQNYIKYSIVDNDYIKHEANTYLDIVPSEKNNYATFFVGSDILINDLIIFRNSVSFAIYILLIISAVIGLLVNYKNKWFIFFVCGFLLLFIDFRVGLIVLSTLIYFNNGSILRKRYNLFSLILMTLVGIFVLDSSLYIMLLLLLLLFRLNKNFSYQTIVTVITLSILLSVHVYDYEFDYFTILYKEIHLIPFIAFIALMSYKKKNQGNERIDVNLLREINHDFKIPLSVLKLNNEMLHSENFETEAKRNNLLNASTNAIKTLEDMLSSINAFLSNNRYVSKQYSTSLLACIEKAQDIFSRQEKHVEFVVLCDEDDTILHIDAIWLDRLLFNLLDNAFKYTDDYGTVTLTYKKEKHYTTLIVEDTGIGIAKEDVQKVTTPFFRGDKSRSISGLGLGLSIVKNIIDQLNGELTIHSRFGEGTTVTIKV